METADTADTVATPNTRTPAPADASRVGGDTRSQVMSVLLKRGPVAASDIAEELDLSAAGVRRHVDKLVEEKLAEPCAPRAVAGEEQGRGRPAKHFQLTAAGRERFGSHYDGLALDAVELIQQIGGEDAVRDFARARVEKILGNVEPSDDPEVTARRVAAALEKHGYAPSVHRTDAGIQICQHHCPVAAVAAAHPEFCGAEREAVARIVDTHVQPLALISDGDGICTTNIPLAAARTRTRPAGTATKGAADHD